MLFKRSAQRYGQTPEPVTPYQKAAQVWDDRIGAVVVQAKNWRLLAFGTVAVSLTLSAGMVWLAGQNRVTPYVVEVGEEGQVRALGPATTPYNPSDAQISWFLARFITNIRSLSIDPVLVRQNWLDAYAFATDDAALFLNAQAQALRPVCWYRRAQRHGADHQCRSCLQDVFPGQVGRTGLPARDADRHRAMDRDPQRSGRDTATRRRPATGIRSASTSTNSPGRVTMPVPAETPQPSPPASAQPILPTASE